MAGAHSSHLTAVVASRRHRRDSGLHPRRRRRGLLACCCVGQRSEDEFMSQALAMAEFLLFIIVLVLFLEIGPSEMPAKCSSKVQQACLDDYTTADQALPISARPANGINGGPAGASFWPNASPNNGPEARLALEQCGSSRVWCWRSGIKFMLYQTDGALDDHAPIRDYHKFFEVYGEYTTENSGIPGGVLFEYGPSIKYCHCMLTTNGTSLLPTHTHAWRMDTDYYCTIVTRDQWVLGGFGLALLLLLTWTRSMVDSDSDEEEDSFYKHGMKVTVLSLLWLYYSISTVALLWPYATRDMVAQDCEFPSANVLFYVFYLALLSLFCSIIFAVGGVIVMYNHRVSKRRATMIHKRAS
eukprot:m.48680 g.48680  ORF g.48680 m.48680 type:complete len:356 (-) comp8927_c0_seq2:62-1129(-)